MRLTPSVAFGDTSPVEGEEGARSPTVSSDFAPGAVSGIWCSVEKLPPFPPLNGEGGCGADGWGVRRPEPVYTGSLTYISNVAITGTWSEGRSQPRAWRRISMPLSRGARLAEPQMWSSLRPLSAASQSAAR